RLKGQTVIVTGAVSARPIPDAQHGTHRREDMVEFIQVTGIEAEQREYVKKEVKLEIRGKLVEDSRENIRPYNVALYVTVNGKDYYLHFAGNKELSEKAGKLINQTVIVTGTLEIKDGWNIVHVNGIEAAPT